MPTIEEFMNQYGSGAQKQQPEQQPVQQTEPTPEQQPRRTIAEFMNQYGGDAYKQSSYQSAPISAPAVQRPAQTQYVPQFRNANMEQAYNEVQNQLQQYRNTGRDFDSYYQRADAIYQNAQRDLAAKRDEYQQLQADVGKEHYWTENGYQEYTLEQMQQKRDELARLEEELKASEQEVQRLRYISDFAGQSRYDDLHEHHDYSRNVEAGKKILAQFQRDQSGEQGMKRASSDSGFTGIGSAEDYYAPRTPDERWTEQERNNYLYFLGKNPNDPAAAYQYAMELNDAYNMAQANEKLDPVREAGRNADNWVTAQGQDVNGIVGTALSFPSGLINQGRNYWEYLMSGHVSPRSNPSLRDYVNAYNQGNQERMNKEHGTLGEEWGFLSGKGLGDVNALANSMAESAVLAGGAKALTALGGSEKLAKGLSGALFFGNAADQTTQEALRRGATSEQALTLGTLAGIAEVAGEELSIDNFIHMNDPVGAKQILLAIAKQGGVEATEEANTTLLNTYFDRLVMGDKSELNTKIDDYIADGMTRSEAEKKAWTEWTSDIATDMLGGLLSGGALGSLNVASTKLRNTVETNRANAKTQQQRDLVSMLDKCETDADYVTTMERITGDRKLAQTFRDFYRTEPSVVLDEMRAEAEQNAQEEQPVQRPTRPNQAQTRPDAAELLTGVQARSAENTNTQTPNLAEPRTPAQQRVTRLLNAEMSEEQLRQVVEVIKDDPALASAYYELTGQEIEDFEASIPERPQNGAGEDAGPGSQITPDATAPSTTPNSGEFNSGSDFSEVDEAATAKADYQNFTFDLFNKYHPNTAAMPGASAVDLLIGTQYNGERGAKVDDRVLARDAYIAQAVRDSDYIGDGSFDQAVEHAREIIEDDWRNESRIIDGQGEWAAVPPKIRAAVLNAAVGTESLESLDIWNDIPAEYQQELRDAIRNHRRLSETYAWNYLSRKQRQALKSAVLNRGSEYWARGNEVIKSDILLNYDKDVDPRDAYSIEMMEAGIDPLHPSSYEARQDIDLSQKSDEEIEKALQKDPKLYSTIYKDENAPRRIRGVPDATAEEIAELNRFSERNRAHRHRESFEKWLTENDLDKMPPIRNARLGKPSVDIRDVLSQRLMRDKELLGHYVNGEGIFEGWYAAKRLDRLRRIFPEASWSIVRQPTPQAKIEANKRAIAEWDAKFKEWRAENADNAKSETRYKEENPRPKMLPTTESRIVLSGDPAATVKLFGKGTFDWAIEKPKPKKTVKGPEAKEGVNDESKQKQSSGRPVGTEGTTRRISREALEQDVEELRRNGGLRDDGRPDGKDYRPGRRGGEERNAGAAPVLKSEEEVKEWKQGLDNANKKGWQFIGALTQSMADVNKFLNKFGIPATHCDTSQSTEYNDRRAGGFAGRFNIFLGWGGFNRISVNCKVVHEVTHQKVDDRLGVDTAASAPCAKALLKSSASAETLKSVVDNYRKRDGEKYAERKYSMSYGELDSKQRRKIDELVYEEVFSDACAKNFTDKMHDAGFTMSQLSELHELCMDQAEAFGIFTKEERGWIKDFLKKPIKDDYRQELENQKKRVEVKNKAASENEDAKREAQRKREASFRNGEHNYVPSSGGSPKLKAGLNENRSVPERGPTSPIETDLNSKNSKDEGYKSVDRTAENRERWLREHPNSEYAKWRASQFSDVDEYESREQLESRLEEIDRELYDLERQAEYEASQYENFNEQYAGEYDQRIEDLENERIYLQDQIKDLDSSEKSGKKPSKGENPYLGMSLNEIEQKRDELDLLSEEAAYKSEVAYFEGGSKEYFDEQARLLDEAEKAIENDMYRNLRKQEGDYRLGEKNAKKLARSEFEKDNLLNEPESGGIDVDAEDFELPPLTMQEKEDRRKVDIKNYKSDSDGTPESSNEYKSKPQRESRKLIDRVEYSEQQREREKTRDVEEAEYKAQSKEDEQARKDAEKAERLADAKKAFGEEGHERLTELGKKLSDLVGTKRVQTSARGDVHEAFSYRDGGRDIEPVVKAFNGMLSGDNTFEDVVNAYHGLATADRDGKMSGYFFDGSFNHELEGIMEDIESGNVTNKDGSFKPDFVARIEKAGELMAHRFGVQQKELVPRAEASKAFEGEPGKVREGAKQDIANFFKRLNLIQLRPSTAFKSFAGYAQKAGKVFYDLAKKSRDSVRNYINTYQTAQEYFRELTNHKDWKKFSQGKIQVRNVVPGLKGNTLSANMALGYLKTLETDGAIEHIVENGIVETARNEKEYWSGRANKGFGTKNGYSQIFDMVGKETRSEIEKAIEKGDDYALDQARDKAAHELENVKKALKAEIAKVDVAQKAYEASFKVMGFLRRAMNKTSRSVWGVDFATQDKFYWPLSAGGDRAGGELLNGSSWGLNNYRNIQKREGSRGGLKIEAFTDVMENYIRQASSWAAYQGLSDELDLLSRNYRDTKSLTQLLQDNVGSHAVKWLNNYVADLNGTRDGERFAWLGKMRGKVAQGSLLLNGSVALKQAPSGLDFMGILDSDIVAKRFATGFWRSARHFKNNELINTVNQYTGMLTNRQMGYNIVEQGEATEAGRKDLVGKAMDALPGWMTNWITKTDYRTVANGMLACADQIDRYIKNGVGEYKGMEKGSDAYYEAVADLFERAVIDTQPIYNKEYRADYLRTHNEFFRTLGMFRTQQTQNYNNFVESIGELQAAKREGTEADVKAAQKRVRGTIGGQMAAATMFSILGTAAKLLLHKQKDYEDDEGKLDWNKVLQRTGFNALNSALSTSWLGSMISPLLIDRSTQLLNKASGGKVVATNEYYSTEDSVLGLFDDIADSGKALMSNPTPKAWKSFVLSTAAATGLPLRNVYNMLNTVAMYSLDLAPGMKGYNYKNEDDFMNILNEWYAADAKTRAKITTQRALSLRDNKNYDLARVLLGSLDPTDKESKDAIRKELTNAFVLGKLDELTYRNFLQNYAKVDRDAVNDLVDAGKEKSSFQAAQNRATGGNEERAEEQNSELKAYTGDNDPNGAQRMELILSYNLSADDTDAYVNHYMASKYRDYYGALRESGFSPARANKIIQSVNADKNTSISQAELWAAYESGRMSEAYIEMLWNASGYKKSWADYKRSKGR